MNPDYVVIYAEAATGDAWADGARNHRRSLDAVANAAVTDVLQRMIADVESDMAVDMPIECDAYVLKVLRTYLPAPTADEGDADHD